MEAHPNNADSPYTRKGYLKLAHIMEFNPAGAIFRRFDGLTALSLLSLQAEILIVKKELEEQSISGDVLNLGCMEVLLESGGEQLKTLKKLRILMKDYSKSREVY